MDVANLADRLLNYGRHTEEQRTCADAEKSRGSSHYHNIGHHHRLCGTPLAIHFQGTVSQAQLSTKIYPLCR